MKTESRIGPLPVLDLAFCTRIQGPIPGSFEEQVVNTPESVTVYVRLIDRPDHLEAVKAVKLSADKFRLLESSPDPEHHIWGYGEGDEVVCIEVEFAPGERGFIVEATAALS